MSKHYPPILLNKITDDAVIEMLEAIIPVFQELGIAYFVVGAFARDVEMLAKGYTSPPQRKTNDLDIAVMLTDQADFDQLKAKLTALGRFKPHDTEPIKLIYDHRYELDLLPFGDIANEKGEVELKAKNAFTVDMPGFTEVFSAVDRVPTQQGYDLNVCSLPGVVLLKLFAWDDRKERRKDIQDIEYIIRNLYLLEIEEIVSTEADLLDLFDDATDHYTERVVARYIGRKMGYMLAENPKLLAWVQDILAAQTRDPYNSPMGVRMTFPTVEEAVAVIDQLRLGVEDVGKEKET